MKKKRYEWAKKNKSSKIENWMKVMLTDECYFFDRGRYKCSLPPFYQATHDGGVPSLLMTNFCVFDRKLKVVKGVLYSLISNCLLLVCIMGKYKTEKITSFIFWTIATGIFLAAFLSQNWISSAKGSYGLIEWCTTKICYNYGQFIQ